MSAKLRWTKDIRLGDRVRLLSGPWAGHEGQYIANRSGVFGIRKVVRLDNEEEAFVKDDDHWERVLKAA